MDGRLFVYGAAQAGIWVGLICFGVGLLIAFVEAVRFVEGCKRIGGKIAGIGLLLAVVSALVLNALE